MLDLEQTINSTDPNLITHNNPRGIPSTLNSIQVNGIFLNQDNSLMSVATDKGYKIYESYNFQQVSEEDEIQELIGALKIAIPFYESHLVLFVGRDESSTFPHNQLVLWDDIKKMKIGVIMLKEKIIDAKIYKEGIFIMVQGKILIFDTKTLKYVYTVIDVDHVRTQKLYLSVGVSPVVLVNIPMTRPNQLKITKLLSTSQDSNTIITGKLHLVISTPFKSIYKLNISKKGDSAIIIGHPKNKVHIYSLIDFQLKFCLDSEFEQQKILNISVSKKTKFFSILYSDYNLEIYNLTEEKRVNEHCNCMTAFITGVNGVEIGGVINTNTENNSNTSKSLTKKAKSFFTSTLSKIKGMIFEKSRKSFCKYKFHPDSLEEDLDQYYDNTNNNDGVNYYLNTISANDSRGLVEKLKFNTKEGGYCWCYKTINWIDRRRGYSN